MFQNRSYFLLSLTGLAICIAAVLLIAMHIANELSYDRFHTKVSRIVTINSRFNGENESRLIARIPFPAKPILLNHYPEVEKVVRMYRDVQVEPLLQHGDVRYTEGGVVYTDPEFLEVFDFELVHGNRENPFPTVNSIIVTDQSALRYFGSSDPLGKTIRYQNAVDLTVVGVVKAPPVNSHIKFDFLVPVELQRQRWKVAVNNFYDLEEDWNWHGAWTYVLLKGNSNPDQFAKKIVDIPRRYYPEDERNNYTFELQHMASVHMDAESIGKMSPSGSKQQVMMFVGISVFLLLMGSINYTNLAIAHLMNRLKEAGLRQTLGARKGDIVFQFVCESVVMACAALLIGLAIAQLTQPFFAPLFDGRLLEEILFEPSFLITCILCAVFIGIASGLYPSITLSRYSAFKAFKSVVIRQNTSLYSVRSILVMVQLAMSTLMIMGALIIRDQLDFVKEADLGYKKDNILTITNAITMNNYEAFRNEVSNLPGVEQVYRGYFPGASMSRHTFHIQGESQPLPMFLRFIGPNFLETFDIPLVRGRHVPQVLHPDSSRYILINEKGVSQLGWTNDEAIGKLVSYTGGNDNKTVYKLEIIGVIRDANFESLYNPIQPSFFQPMDGGDVAILMDGRSLGNTIEAIKQAWNKTEPGTPMNYSFLSDSIEGQYHKEEKLSKAIFYFTSLAITVSCIGLIGLTSFLAQQRTKEVGIRKVHGANATDISQLFMGYFLKLSFIALAVSIPIGFFVTESWLQNFAFHVNPGVGIIVKCSLTSMILSIASVIFNVIKASKQNPVVSIKHE
jgi:putative ABC transport system permease protein